MLLLVLILVLLAFALLVVALLSGSVLAAWVSVGLSIVAAVVLLIDWLQRRAAVKAGEAALVTSAGEPAAPRAPVQQHEPEPATEILPIIPPGPGGFPGERQNVDAATMHVAAPPSESRPAEQPVGFDHSGDGQNTTIMPVVQPSGSGSRPSGAEDEIPPSGGSSSPSVTKSGGDGSSGPAASVTQDEATSVVDVRKSDASSSVPEPAPSATGDEESATVVHRPGAGAVVGGVAAAGAVAAGAALFEKDAKKSERPDGEKAADETVVAEKSAAEKSAAEKSGAEKSADEKSAAEKAEPETSAATEVESGPELAGENDTVVAKVADRAAAGPGAPESGGQDAAVSDAAVSDAAVSDAEASEAAVSDVPASDTTASDRAVETSDQAVRVQERPSGSSAEATTILGAGGAARSTGNLSGHDLFGSSTPERPAQGSAPQGYTAAQAPADAYGAAGSAPSYDGEPPEEHADAAAVQLVAGLEDEVIVIDEQPRYHVPGCRSLSAQTPIPLPAREAVELGFTPCGWCSPDRTLAGRHPAAAR